jgi:uncharacterized protein YndB with AHSA1/START domain
VIVLAIGAAFVVGGRLPVSHTAAVTDTIPASQQRVWEMITDVSSQPQWRTGLKAVTPLAPEGNASCWAEVQSGMTMPLCADSSEAPTRRVVRISDPKLPFGGTWTYELEPAGVDATKVTITEHGTTAPAIWRFMGHYFIGEDGQIKQYLGDLKKAASHAG